MAASINAVLDQKGPPPAEARAPSDVRAGPRRLRATARQRQGAEPHSGAANRTSTTGTAIGAGCARTSTPTCVLLPRSVCPVGPLHSSSSRSSLTCSVSGALPGSRQQSGRGLIRHSPRSHPPCPERTHQEQHSQRSSGGGQNLRHAWQFVGSGAASISEPSTLKIFCLSTVGFWVACLRRVLVRAGRRFSNVNTIRVFCTPKPLATGFPARATGPSRVRTVRT